MSAQTQLPPVNTAVEHLLELADRMKADQMGFNDADICNIDVVIECLHELDGDRNKVHDDLETETIKSSILRHKLLGLPANINDEIQAAVSSARQSNADALTNLQDKLESANKNTDYLAIRQQELDKENAIIHPQRESIKKQHEEIISQLNRRMAEKASLQISLNETRDKVRQTNQNIVDLEDSILQLKEDLIQERTDARVEKKRLKVAVADTSEKTTEQKRQNNEKKRELDTLIEELTENEAELDQIRKSIRRFETSRSKLEGQERALSAHLNRELKQNEELSRKGAAIINEDLRIQQEFDERKKMLQDKLVKLEKDTFEHAHGYDDLENRKVELAIELKAKMAVRHEDSGNVNENDEILQMSKELLAQKAEEVGRMQSENIEMTEQIEAIGESHKAVVSQLSKQVEDYREQLKKERKDRMDLQGNKEEVHKELEDFKHEHQKFMVKMNDDIQNGKQKHLDLTNEGATLQRTLKEDEDDIKKLKAELENVQSAYSEMFDSMQTKVQTIENEIIQFETEIDEKNKQIKERTPVFNELEIAFEEKTKEYDRMKKDVVGKKAKKSLLEESIMKAKREKEALGEPKEILKKDLKQKRNEAMQQLKSTCEEMRNIELEIHNATCRRQTVQDENEKFTQGIEKMGDDLKYLQDDLDYMENLKKLLLAQLEEEKKKLIKSWMEEREIQKVFEVRDQEVVEELGSILNRAADRGDKIDSITSRLEGELMVLAQFLDNVSTRRPKDTRESRRTGSRMSQRSRTSQAIDLVVAANVDQQAMQNMKKTRMCSRSRSASPGHSPVSYRQRNSSESKSVDFDATETPRSEAMTDR